MTSSEEAAADSTYDDTEGHAEADETIGLLGGAPAESFAERYHLTWRGRLRRLRQIASVARHYDVLHGLTPVKLRMMLEALGPTFVKVGQILSMRSEILPQAFCNELAKLRADADPMPYRTVLNSLKQEYGKPVDQVFASIDPTPLGSASLAQVHRARLLDGRDVAVKVQRPGVRQTMAQDVSIMRSFASHASRLMRSAQVVDVKGVVEELWETFQSETDFLLEARNLQDFRTFCGHYAYMDCPKPYLPLCTPHVVVMDYVEGIRISHTDQLAARGYDLDEIGRKLVDNYAAQILDEGFFHADPHPGNILIRGGQIVLIDLGMTGRIDARTRELLRKMIFAVAARDSPALADALLQFHGTGTGLDDYPSMLADLDLIIEQYGTVDLSELNIGDFIGALMRLARRHGIEMPSSVTMVARCLVTLEGLLDQFLPKTNMIDIISRHIVNSESLSSRALGEVKTTATESRLALHGLLGTLAEAKTATRMLTRGQLRTNIELVGSKEPLSRISDMVNRLTMALIVVGLYVGSSIVYFAGIKPVVFGIPVVGMAGYVVAFVLSMWILIDIFRENRAQRRDRHGLP